jgi:hypothetical protein
LRILRILIVLVVATAVVLLLAALTPGGRAGMKAVSLVGQVLMTAPYGPLDLVTSSPEHRAITYPTASGSGEADLYRIPDGERRAALVLFLGVTPIGRDDERIVRVATGLARAGFVVLVPWSQNMVSGRVDSSDVELAVAAFRHLQTLDYVDSDRIGSGGFCVGASLLAIAAADPRIRDDVRFVSAFAPYYDGRDYLAQVAARQAFFRGETRPWQPDSLTVEVFQRLLLEELPEPAEREALWEHFQHGAPLSERAVQALSPDARTVYALLSGTTLDQARALIERLPDEMRARMDRLSPRGYLEDVRADLWIMHDRDDPLVPIEESQRMYDAVGGRDDVLYTEFSLFQHVEPGGAGGPLDLVTEGWKLLRHVYRIVRLAS